MSESKVFLVNKITCKNSFCKRLRIEQIEFNFSVKNAGQLAHRFLYYSLLTVTLTGSMVLQSTELKAADYYIAPNGNDNNSGTLEQPWRTIAKANDSLLAGDTVLIRAGSYSHQIRPMRSGTSDNNRIVYKAYGDGDVILTGFLAAQGPAEGAIALGQRNYVTVSGRADGDPIDTRRIRAIATSPVNSLGNLCGSEGSIVENVYFSCPDNSRYCDRGFSICINYWSGNYESKFNVFRGNFIRGISDPNGENDTEDLFNIAQNAHHNLLENNIMEVSTHSVLYMDGPRTHSTVVRGNVIRNPQHTALSAYYTGVESAGDARLLIENNWLEASGDISRPDGGPGNAFQWGAGELVIRHNVITKGASQDNTNRTNGGLMGSSGHSYGSDHQATDGRVYNNTIVKNQTYAVGVFDFNDTIDLGRNKFVNNFIYGWLTEASTGQLLVSYWVNNDAGKDRYIRNVLGNPGGSANQPVINVGSSDVSLATAVADYRNPTYPEFTSWHGYDNEYSAAPGFSNYNQDNYALQSNSPYVDGGAPLTRVTAGCGTSTLTVEDARYFFAEAGEFPSWMGVEMDWVAIGSGNALSAGKRQLESVNDASSQLSFSTPVPCSNGDYVWLWKNSSGVQVVHGNAPDIGAYELISGDNPPAPAELSAVQNFRVMENMQ